MGKEKQGGKSNPCPISNLFYPPLLPFSPFSPTPRVDTLPYLSVSLNKKYDNIPKLILYLDHMSRRPVFPGCFDVLRFFFFLYLYFLLFYFYFYFYFYLCVMILCRIY